MVYVVGGGGERERGTLGVRWTWRGFKKGARVTGGAGYRRGHGHVRDLARGGRKGGAWVCCSQRPTGGTADNTWAYGRMGRKAVG